MSISIAVILAFATLICFYAIAYALVLRNKKRRGMSEPVQKEKPSENAGKQAKQSKGDYGYCALNEIVGYDIVEVKDMSVREEDMPAATETEHEPTFNEARGVGLQPVMMGTTGSDSYQVTDEPVPSPEELARRRQKEKELRRLEEERRRLDEEERRKLEEQRIMEEMDNTFVNDDSSDTDVPQDPQEIQRSIEEFYMWNSAWTETLAEEYSQQLSKLKPSPEDVKAAAGEESHQMSLEQIKDAFKNNELSTEDEMDIERKLKKFDKNK